MTEEDENPAKNVRTTEIRNLMIEGSREVNEANGGSTIFAERKKLIERLLSS